MELQGAAASPGAAAGPAFWLRPFVPASADRGLLVPEQEAERLDRAVATAQVQLAALRVETDPLAGEILTVHELLLEDPALMDLMREAISAGCTAEEAVSRAVAHWREVLQGLDDPYLRERAADAADLGLRLVRELTGRQMPLPLVPSVILADELTPSDTVSLRKLALGFVLAQGGPTSHAAILARQWGIPAVTGVAGLEGVPDGTFVLVDGGHGVVYPNPDHDLIVRHIGMKEKLVPDTHPATTLEGYRLEVAANAAGPDDVREAYRLGAEGIGLLRTEFLFLRHAAPPSADQQAASLVAAAEAMQGRPVIVRALDAGGDKPLPYMPALREENPFLGVRGIRLLLGPYRALFQSQIHAILRAGAPGILKLMLPMVTTPAEVEEARRLLEAEGAGGVPLGIMIETPSAALSARNFVGLADFFSIGTNDLTQYTLAVDRGNRHVSALYDPLHPAVLRLIKLTAEAGIWTGVCGELASDPLAVPLWIAWGIREVSVVPRAIAVIKRRIRAWDRPGAEAAAIECLEARSGAEVRELLMRRSPHD